MRLYGEPRRAARAAGARARAAAAPTASPATSLCVVSGALDGIERVLEAHLRPGDRVAVENPGYAALFDLLRARGLVARARRGRRPRDASRASCASALARGARAAIITPRGQNPTGAALDARARAELREVLARRPGRSGDRGRPPRRRSPAASCTRTVDRPASAGRPRARWPRRSGPDLRLAVLAGDAHTVARVQGRQQCGPGWVSHILQRSCSACGRDPAVQALVGRAGATYAERRERLLELPARPRRAGAAAPPG